MFTQEIIDRVSELARQDKVEPAVYLAVCEVESSGKPFEKDGMTARFLPERHKFYAELPINLRAQAVKAGLALARRNAKTQYKDLGTFEGKMRWFNAACEIDGEAAHRACSWGLGQVMGFHAQSLGYENAVDMVEQFETGVEAQLEGMIRFIRRNNLVDECRRKDFAGFARGYNGEAYDDAPGRENDYDVKIEKAYTRWKAKLSKLSYRTASLADLRDEGDDVVKSNDRQLAVSGLGIAGLGLSNLDTITETVGNLSGKAEELQGYVEQFQTVKAAILPGVGDNFLWIVVFLVLGYLVYNAISTNKKFVAQVRQEAEAEVEA